MMMMKRFSLLTAGLLATALVAAPGPASAKLVELGQTTTPIAAPICPKGVSPSQCFIILTRTTAIQSVSDGVTYPTTVKQDGWVVAFTVGLSRLSTNAATEKNYLHVLDQAYGGTPQLALTVLTPGGGKTLISDLTADVGAVAQPHRHGVVEDQEGQRGECDDRGFGSVDTGHGIQDQTEGCCDQHHADGDENRGNADHLTQTSPRNRCPLSRNTRSTFDPSTIV